jgi:hypothetical protein
MPREKNSADGSDRYNRFTCLSTGYPSQNITADKTITTEETNIAQEKKGGMAKISSAHAGSI